ncbi:UPF0149 family protein [Bowmanella sp. Y26]|uniref:UPF0149 family protein n=1 Tax=Bowmanella yangjiangensis TaxID=2811230 RepID=UPI001BDBC8D0|nr:UPF0149 family protein [Bowmanella yangjiangensis]MBT1064326.1 UPF0149 family protein [Bowmanella yangjiangensis]
MTGKSEVMGQDLKTLCEDHPQLLRSYHEVCGLLFSVAAAPQIPAPQQWMPWVLISDEMSAEVAEKLTQSLMDCFKAQLLIMRDEGNLLPRVCVYHAGLTLEDALSQWMSGCLLGHQHLQKVWQQAWSQMQQQAPDDAPQAAKELSHLLRLFSTFANVPMALEQAAAGGNIQLAAQLAAIAETLPRALRQYVSLAGKLAVYLPHQFETFISGQDPAP